MKDMKNTKFGILWSTFVSSSFENRTGERSLTSFEMTGIVIPSRSEESFSQYFLSLQASVST